MIRGTRKRGLITDIITDINEMNWTKNRPHYIRVLFDSGYVLCHPSQIREVK